MKVNLPFLGKEHEIEIDKDHYIRRLGMPKDHDVPEHVAEGMEWAIEWYKNNGNPWMNIYELDVRLDNEQLYLNGHLTQAPKVYKRFEKYGVKKAMLVLSTAGDKVDTETTALWSSDYPDRSFFLDTYAASVTEAIVTFAIQQIKEWAERKELDALSRYSPGYPGWELKEQILLMDIINQVSADKVPVVALETALLTPLKSQLSLVGIHTGEKKEKPIEIACMECTFMDCKCNN